MASTFPAQLHYFEPKLTKVAPTNSNGSSSHNNNTNNPYSAFDDEIPTVDYSMLFSNDHDQRFFALEYLRYACETFGFFYLVNHTVPDRVVDDLMKGISEFFDLTLDEKSTYSRKDPYDRIRWDKVYNSNENREFLKVVLHPHYQAPAKPSGFSKTLEEYSKEMRTIVIGLAKAVSKTLGVEENYIEEKFKLKSGFDVMHVNRYPPNLKSKSAIGLLDHTDPGFMVALVEDLIGGLQIQSHEGKWINAYIPQHAILIQLADQLEILTNGKYKSHVHRVIVDNNKVKRTSVAILFGPSMDTFTSPATEFVDDEHPQEFLGKTYKDFLEANGNEQINVTSSIADIRLPKLSKSNNV